MLYRNCSSVLHFFDNQRPIFHETFVCETFPFIISVSIFTIINANVINAAGVGDQVHNFVYRFAPWRDLGCWRDVGDGRTMRLLDNFRQRIDWFHMEKTGKYLYSHRTATG